jgi:hypothetical protein
MMYLELNPFLLLMLPCPNFGLVVDWVSLSCAPDRRNHTRRPAINAETIETAANFVSASVTDPSLSFFFNRPASYVRPDLNHLLSLASVDRAIGIVGPKNVEALRDQRLVGDGRQSGTATVVQIVESGRSVEFDPENGVFLAFVGGSCVTVSVTQIHSILTALFAHSRIQHQVS